MLAGYFPKCQYLFFCFIYVYSCILSLDASLTADIGSGIVIAVPIPKQASLLGEGIEKAIVMAVEEAR